MIPIQHILNRINWDPALNPSNYNIHYYDRLENRLIERNYVDLFGGNDGAVEPDLIDKKASLPLHRIRKIAYKGKVIWRRK